MLISPDLGTISLRLNLNLHLTDVQPQTFVDVHVHY